MRLIPFLLLMASCTPSIEKMERHDKTMTDSAMSVLDGLTPDTVSVTIERVKTLESVRYVDRVEYIESSPVLAMVRPVSSERSKVDTVYIYRVDTVYIAK